MSASGAMALTGLVLVVATIATGAWVSSYSKGYDHKAWHRPMVAALGTLSAIVLIISFWMQVGS